MPTKTVRILVLPALLAVACSIGIRRDLSAVSPGQVGFDDMCGLQAYFDKLEIRAANPPRLISSVDLEGAEKGKPVRGGRERFAFEGDVQLTTVRRVLEENWERLPESLGKASQIEIEVRWSEKAGSKRVVTTEAAELAVGPGADESWELPYHPCLSELLYGEPLYRQRRTSLGLPLPLPAGVLSTDGGAPSSRPDGAVDARSSELAK